MKIKIIVIVTAILAIYPAFSATASTATDRPVPLMRESRAQQIRDQLRADFEARLQNSKNNENIRNNALKTKSRTISTRSVNSTASKLEKAYDSLVEVRDRLVIRITKDQDSGRDTSEAMSLLDTAHIALDQAKNSLSSSTAALPALKEAQVALQRVLDSISEDQDQTATTTDR